MRILLMCFFMVVGFTVISQIPHDKPDHPKGNNSNDQYLALPHYNEACELYAKGDVQKAKRSLQEAINISMALTEAQLFLGAIFYGENKPDSACLYLNSGIDFAPETMAHFYFMFFESAFKIEEYTYASHWLKSFEKLFGKIDDGLYEADFNYTVDDWERIKYSLDIIYDYNYWIPGSHIIDTLELGEYAGFSVAGDDIWVYKENVNKVLSQKKSYTKGKALKYDLANPLSLSVSESQHMLFISRKDPDGVNIYFAKREGKKWGTLKKIEGDVNSLAWDSDPFFYEEGSLIYFSSDRNGSKDIYVSKFDPETGLSGKAINIERINTRFDEIKPKFVNGEFYFASNGLPGFGGFDLYSTDHWWLENGILQPSDWFNMGKPYNSGKDELGIFFLKNKQHIVHHKDWKGNQWFVLMHFLQESERFDMNIRMTEFPVDVD